MPPKRAPFNDTMPSLPPPTTATISNNADEQAHSHAPERNPTEVVAGITQAQKQALVDNLQLESKQPTPNPCRAHSYSRVTVTERARKLRAQYAMQAQGLRTRLEMRVNRIPQALRKRNIQELLDEHAERARPAPPPPVPAKVDMPTEAPAARSSFERKSLKRQRWESLDATTHLTHQS